MKLFRLLLAMLLSFCVGTLVSFRVGWRSDVLRSSASAQHGGGAHTRPQRRRDSADPPPVAALPHEWSSGMNAANQTMSAVERAYFESLVLRVPDSCYRVAGVQRNEARDGLRLTLLPGAQVGASNDFFLAKEDQSSKMQNKQTRERASERASETEQRLSF